MDKRQEERAKALEVAIAFGNMFFSSDQGPIVGEVADENGMIESRKLCDWTLRTADVFLEYISRP